MTKSILNDCLLIKDQPLSKMKEYFKAIGVSIFDTILSRTPLSDEHIGVKNTISEEESKLTVLYILTAYSEESPLVILRQDAREEREAICEYLQIPDYQRSKLATLSDPDDRKAAIKYIEQFAEQDFKTLMFLKIQLSDIERDITNRAFTTCKEEGKAEDGSIYLRPYYDFKEHGKAMKTCETLAKAITNIENEIKAKTTYRAINLLKEWKSGGADKKIKESSGGISIENSPLIKKQVYGQA